MQDKDELQKKVCEQLIQLSQLRSQVNDRTLSTTASQSAVASESVVPSQLAIASQSLVTSQSVVDVERPSNVAELSAKVDELNSALEVRDREV